MTDRLTDRRSLLAAGGMLLTAGCLGGSDPGGGGTGSGGSAGGTLAAHPAGRDIDAQPAEGPPSGEADATIVAFEDPSCPRCAAFERQTVPRIRSELVEPGRATFVFRGYPVVYEWGRPATRALEATFARDPGAHWELAAHYFETQSRFTTDNVRDHTAAFLDAETAVDGTAVVEAVDAGEADAAVEADLAAGRDAGASATPAIFLFRDGEYRTKASGSVSYEVISSALDI